MPKKNSEYTIRKIVYSDKPNPRAEFLAELMFRAYIRGLKRRKAAGCLEDGEIEENSEKQRDQNTKYILVSI
jgi:hypothetical protein